MVSQSTDPARPQDRDRPANRALDRFRQDTEQVPACPEWCESEPGHPFTRLSPHSAHRHHELKIGTIFGADDSELDVSIMADEFADRFRVEVLPPLVVITADHVRLTAEGAAQVSAMALRASTRLGRIAAVS